MGNTEGRIGRVDQGSGELLAPQRALVVPDFTLVRETSNEVTTLHPLVLKYALSSLNSQAVFSLFLQHPSELGPALLDYARSLAYLHSGVTATNEPTALIGIGKGYLSAQAYGKGITVPNGAFLFMTDTLLSNKVRTENKGNRVLLTREQATPLNLIENTAERRKMQRIGRTVSLDFNAKITYQGIDIVEIDYDPFPEDDFSYIQKEGISIKRIDNLSRRTPQMKQIDEQMMQEARKVPRRRPVMPVMNEKGELNAPLIGDWSSPYDINALINNLTVQTCGIISQSPLPQSTPGEVQSFLRSKKMIAILAAAGVSVGAGMYIKSRKNR